MKPKDIAIKCIGDAFIVILMFIAITVLNVNVKPFHRGFYCYDESLMYPYKDSTVPSYVLFGVGLGVTSIIIIIIEVCEQYATDIHRKSDVYGVPVIILKLYRYVGAFLIGAEVTQILTDIGKVTIGRLRPHFFHVCDLDHSQMNCTTRSYITEYTCLQTKPRLLDQMRKSFPSGHSSMAMYCAVYFTLYIRFRISNSRINLFGIFLQLIAFSLALYTCLSRISDYKHHWSDVLSGGILGTIVAIVVPLYLLRVFDNEDRCKANPVYDDNLPLSRITTENPASVQSNNKTA